MIIRCPARAAILPAGRAAADANNARRVGDSYVHIGHGGIAT